MTFCRMIELPVHPKIGIAPIWQREGLRFIHNARVKTIFATIP